MSKAHDAWVPREPFVPEPQKPVARKPVDLADVKVEKPVEEVEETTEGKPEAKADGLRLLLGVANIDARLAKIEKSLAKLTKAVDALAEKVETSAGRKLTVAEFDAAYEASRRAKDLQDERYEIKPTDETAGGRIQNSDYGATSTDEYNDDANRRLRPRILKKGRS